MIRAGEWAELEEAFEAAVGDCLPAVARKFKLDEQRVLGLWGELMAALAPGVYAGTDRDRRQVAEARSANAAP